MQLKQSPSSAPDKAKIVSSPGKVMALDFGDAKRATTSILSTLLSTFLRYLVSFASTFRKYLSKVLTKDCKYQTDRKTDESGLFPLVIQAVTRISW